MKSPCFEIKRSTAPKSSYLKERIKLNKILTTTRGGNVIGIAPNRKNNDFESEPVDNSVFSSSKLNTARIKTGYAQLKPKLEYGRGAHGGGPMSASASFSNNQLFNMTYRTIDTAKVLNS